MVTNHNNIGHQYEAFDISARVRELFIMYSMCVVVLTNKLKVEIYV